MLLRNYLLGTVVALACGLVLAQALPREVDAALIRAKVPRQAVSLLVVDADGKLPARLSQRANIVVNPASVMKLVTTYAALELLGPTYTWRTPVFLDGEVRNGTLYGNLYLKGQGDPKLTVERLWLLLRRVRGLGVEKINGDIVLDRSAFETLEADPASFDGEPLRPYNAAPEALLINFKSVLMTFVPDLHTNTARVQFEPPLSGVQMQASVPLSNDPSGSCDDYRAALKADFSDPMRISFAGSYPAQCREKVWSVAYADPGNFNARAVEGLWHEMGGQLSGSVHGGRAPALEPSFEMVSPPLAEVIRDINKYSNNLMAQQLFLTLSLPTASRAASREIVRQWWQTRIDADSAPTIDNGSGLSRQSRISAQALAHLLQVAYRSPLAVELMASLPIAGVDGTLKRSQAASRGSAHLKTGSLRDVTALAGYVQGASGKYYVLVAIVNHPNAKAVRPAFDALLDWTVRDN
jgi:D-alanyl-D-alanine carboxypeptidase/D-alanyl-D-alanine-endopeptidase (penicillin-binding protein 4)